MKSILIVDDDNVSIKIMGDILNPYYNVKASNSVEGAFKVLELFNIDLILLDVIMPFITGYDMLETLKKNKRFKDIPVICITGLDDIMDEYRGFELGAVDYISKPAIPSVLLARVNTHIKLSLEKIQLKERIRVLESTSDKTVLEYSKFKDVILMAGIYLTANDNHTVNNSKFLIENIDSKFQKYIKLISKKLIKHKLYSHELNEHEIEKMCLAVSVHDIGTIGVHDLITLKDGVYTTEESLIMQTHTTLGYESIEYALQQLQIEKNDVGYIETAINIIHYHHERWDGTGYPERLKGYEIPLSARIITIIDVFNALISKRNYRKPYNIEDAKQIILNGKGTQFDPVIVDIFEKYFNDIRQITEE